MFIDVDFFDCWCVDVVCDWDMIFNQCDVDGEFVIFVDEFFGFIDGIDKYEYVVDLWVNVGGKVFFCKNWNVSEIFF